MNFNLKVLKGRVEMFVVRCNTFPECSYTYEKLLEESKMIGNKCILHKESIVRWVCGVHGDCLLQ